MGARINFIFDDGSESLPVLYSHWGANNWKRDLSLAFEHAGARWNDPSYWVRMVVSHFLRADLMSATGFGIYAVSASEMFPETFHDSVVQIDIPARTVKDWDSGESFQIDETTGKLLFNYEVITL
jgi:hypothetical protein